MNEPSLEKKIVAAALSSRQAYTRIFAASSFEDSYTPYSGYLLKLISKYYERDEKAQSVDKQVLEEWIKQDLPPKNQELYLAHLNECASIPVSAINIAELVVEAKKKHVGNQLATALLEKRDDDKIDTLIDGYRQLMDVVEDEEEEQYNDISVAAIVEKATDTDGLIKLLPNYLDKICKGKTKPGHHIVVYARPETGKTAITLTMAWGFCLQGLDTIIFGNEEPVTDTILRAQCCFTGMTEEEIIANPSRAQELLNKRGWKHLRFIPLNPGSPREIAKYVERYKPNCIVVDQIRNLHVGGETRVNQLEMAATAMRNIGKKYGCLVVSVTQAGDSADNKLFLDMGDIDFSNTGIPATADLMLGMGVNKEYEALGLRGLSTPKNKIGGIHDRFQVKINTALSRLEDV